MKRIAFFILLFFATVQIVPAVQSLCHAGNGLFFNIDEEKNTEKVGTDDTKETKDYPSFIGHAKDFSGLVNTAFHLTVHLALFPCVENPTPPPNRR